jgi:predicted Zn-dependent protease
VRGSTTPVESQAIQDYVAGLGRKLTASLDQPAVAFTYSVVETNASHGLHEPLALPGGYIFVPLDLLRTAKDEAEFAGMLARAITRKPLTMASHGATIPVVFVDNFGGDSGLPLSLRSRAREGELQSDAAAAPLLSRAGFDPAALVRYIERVQPHPDLARIESLREIIRELPPAAYSESGEFNRIRELARPTPPKPATPPTLLRN